MSVGRTIVNFRKKRKKKRRVGEFHLVHFAMRKGEERTVEKGRKKTKLPGYCFRFVGEKRRGEKGQTTKEEEKGAIVSIGGEKSLIIFLREEK